MAEPTILRPDEEKWDKLSNLKQLKDLNLHRIKNSKILVVGAGALGNEVCKNLVLSSFANLTIVDYAEVTPANLNHCVFFREEDADAHGKKADALADRIMRIFRDVTAEPVVDQIESFESDFFGKFDVVLGCLDNLSSRLHINIRAFMADVPYIDGAAAGYTGRVFVVNPPDSCLQCYMNHTHSQVFNMQFPCFQECRNCGQPRRSRSVRVCPNCGTPFDEMTLFRPRTGATITIKSVIAAIQVREALKIVNEQQDRLIRHMFYYNSRTNYVDVLEVELNPECMVHMSFGVPVISEPQDVRGKKSGYSSRGGVRLG